MAPIKAPINKNKKILLNKSNAKIKANLKILICFCQNDPFKFFIVFSLNSPYKMTFLISFSKPNLSKISPAQIENKNVLKK